MISTFALQLLFFVAVAPLALFITSWIPHWKLNVRKFYSKLNIYPAMSPTLWFGGLQWTLAFTCLYLGTFFLWRSLLLKQQNGMTNGEYTAVFVLLIVQMLFFAVWSIPYYYYRDAIASLFVLLLVLACSIPCTIISALHRHIEAAVLFAVWSSALAFVVVVNTVLILLWIPSKARKRIATPFYSVYAVVFKQRFVAEPMKFKDSETK